MLQMVTKFLGFEFLVWEIQQSLLKCEFGFCWFLVGLVVPVAFVGLWLCLWLLFDLWLGWVVPVAFVGLWLSCVVSMAVRFIIKNVNKN